MAAGGNVNAAARRVDVDDCEAQPCGPRYEFIGARLREWVDYWLDA